MAVLGLKRRQLESGFVDLSKGYEIAQLAPSAKETRRKLPVVATAFERAFGFPITEASRVESPKVVDDFSKYLRGKYEPAYLRNLRSGLFFIIDHSPILEDLSYISVGWMEALKTKIPTLNVAAQTLIYWRQYVEAQRMWPVSAVGHAEITDFQKWLVSEKSLAKHSSAFNRRCEIRDWLRAADLFIEAPDDGVEFSERLQSEFRAMSRFGKNEHVPQHIGGLKRRRYGGNVRPIGDETLKKLKYQIHSWLKWIAKHKGDISKIGIVDLVRVQFLEDYLDDQQKNQACTCETALTTIFNAKSLQRLAMGAKLIEPPSDSTIKELDELEKLVKAETWLPSRNELLSQASRAGKMVRLIDLNNYFIKAVERELPKWSVILKELRELKGPSELSVQAETVLMEVRAAVLVAVEMYLSPRMGDCRSLGVEALRDLEEFVHFGWTPQKTDKKNFAPEVDVCAPPWLTGLLQDYLLVRRFIHAESPALFPAFQRAQARSSQSKKDGYKANISYGQFQDMSRRWLGHTNLSNNLMRKIVGKTYKSLELTDLHKTLGHSTRSREAQMSDNNTEIERDHYMILDDSDRAEIARSNYSILARKLKIKEGLDLSFLDKTTREILRASD